MTCENFAESSLQAQSSTNGRVCGILQTILEEHEKLYCSDPYVEGVISPQKGTTATVSDLRGEKFLPTQMVQYEKELPQPINNGGKVIELW